MATVLTRTPSSTGNQKKYTWSSWVKRSNLGYQFIFTQGNDGNNNNVLVFNADHTLTTWNYQSGFQLLLRTLTIFRDTNAWYHIVISVDTTQATASNRAKMYVNGVQITDFKSGEETYPSQNLDLYINNTHPFKIGSYWNGTTTFDGLMSHVHFIDGEALTPSTFGSTDSTTGEWKINTQPTISSYGTNGFLILKDGNTITDQSPNSNNFTVEAGTLTKTEDNPSNIFCTLNSLVNGDGSYSLTNGSNKFTGTGGNDHTFGTIGAIGGKFYYETKWVTNPDKCFAGFTPVQLASNLGPSETPVSKMSGLYRDDYFINVGDVNEGAYTNVSAGDIFGFAIDLSSSSGSRTLKTYKNGSLINTMTLSTSYENDIWLPVVGDTSSTDGVIECNFGNGYFGTTAVSSAGTNASNNGIFEYDVPSGYTALSTKGLNE